MRNRTRGWIVAGALAACAFASISLISSTATAAPGGQPCGGITGATCPDGFKCVDIPGDGCNPKSGGADCPGVCKRAH